MRTPEEVAREVACPVDARWSEGEGGVSMCHKHGRVLPGLGPCPTAVDLIRARDAEVRADAYARALAYLASAHGNLESNGEQRAAAIAQGWLTKAHADLLGGRDTPG